MLNKVTEVLDKYEEEKEPLEKFITAANVTLEELEPFGMDEEEGKKQVKKLNDLVDDLEKKKHDLRSVNRAGQTLIRHIDLPDKIESDLDKLSDSYYALLDKVKDKRDDTKDYLTKVVRLMQLIVEIEVWIKEIHPRLQSLSQPTTDPGVMKTQLDDIQTVRLDLSRQAPKLGLIYEISQQLTQINISHTTIVKSIESRVTEVKLPIEETIPKTLDEMETLLQSSLASTQKLQDEVDDMLRWLKKMEIALKSQSPLNKGKFDKISASSDVTDGPDEEAQAQIIEMQKLWEELNETSVQRKEVLEEITPVAKEFEKSKDNVDKWFKVVKPKVDGLDVISVVGDKLRKQEETVKELRLGMESHQPDFEKLLETEKPLVENCATDTEPVTEAVSDAKRDWHDVESRLHIAADKVDAMKESLDQLDKNIKPVEEVCSQAEVGLAESCKFGIDLDEGDKEVERLEKLLEDMKLRQPTLEEVHKCADDAVNHDNDPENVSVMTRRTDAVDLRFNELLEKMEKEVDKTKKARDAAKKYNGIVEDAGKRIEDLKEKVDKPLEVAADPEKVKQGLIEVEELQVEANNIEGLCNEATMLGDDIIDFNKLPELENAIHKQLDERKKPLSEATSKLNEREQTLKEQLQKCGAFQDQLDDFQRRLSNFDAKINQLKDRPMSTKSAKNDLIIDELEAFAKDLAQEEPIYDEIIMAANKVLEELESPEEKKAFSDKLEGLIHLWKKVHDDLDNRKSELSDVYGVAKALEDKENDLDSWLDATEKKLNHMKPVSCVPNELEMQRKEANALKSELVSRQPQYDEIAKATEELKERCPEDRDSITQKFANTQQNWNDVSKLLKAREDGIDHMDTKIREFDSKATYCKESIAKLRKTLDSTDDTGLGSKELLKVNEDLIKLKKRVEDLEPTVKTCENLADDLQTYHMTSDCKPIRLQADGITEEYERLKKSVGNKVDYVDEVVNELKAVEGKADDMAKKLKKIGEKVEENRPKKLVVEELTIKAEKMKEAEAELDESKPLINEILRNGNHLVKKNHGDEKLKQDLSQISESRRKYTPEIPALIQELEKLSEDVKKTIDCVADTGSTLEGLESEIDGLKTVGTDADTIRNEMEDLKKLRTEIGAVQATATDCNFLRDELVNYHPNCDSTDLDQNVNAVNARLMDASQKLSDRQGKLEEALVQCGQFSDAVESLIRWLEETQELVEGQGPIATADPNVLKAQIMEQKV
eukprot:Seg1602.3 transcript_id=Seg1602.3/GoldUCD/mRNA.D3Y31 product="Microtubule-actin cross-linking factor 1" protein_id=Seg1602.3/GoldUCD/D3Y31